MRQRSLPHRVKVGRSPMTWRRWISRGDAALRLLLPVFLSVEQCVAYKLRRYHRVICQTLGSVVGVGCVGQSLLSPGALVGLDWFAQDVLD